MARIVLIHGFGSGLSASRRSLPIHLGFSGFLDKLLASEAKLFKWFQVEDHSIVNFFNPIFQLQVYKKEKAATQSTQLHLDLDAFLKKEQPKIIVCHSLGAQFLIAYLNHFVLQKTTKKIVFVQADITSTTIVPRKIEELDILNIYCPWDPSLLISWKLNRYKPAGLVGWLQPGVRNKLIPLLSDWNLHTSSIAQKQFARFVSSL